MTQIKNSFLGIVLLLLGCNSSTVYKNDQREVTLDVKIVDIKESCAEDLQTYTQTPERSIQEGVPEDYIWSSRLFDACTYDKNGNTIMIHWDKQKDWKDSLHLTYFMEDSNAELHLSRPSNYNQIFENQYSYDLSQELDSAVIQIDTTALSSDSLKLDFYLRLKLYYMDDRERFFAYKSFEGCVTCLAN